MKQAIWIALLLLVAAPVAIAQTPLESATTHSALVQEEDEKFSLDSSSLIFNGSRHEDCA